ncbi:beta-ketoacyl-ACP reductase [Marinicella pacifica]|jgi:3-oxoacyl-[acyl-carrier protein] reductase|uniref:3-oxoacyl-[acyl-carrier-protein] reductase n=1 Tax=Marinicella pacifica TaxID=1171543 RepID=A0A917CL86_9GAMM|nr:3-oxoacyl-ACP reductase FabG [Marinicella pacifica]GGF90112.1 beta-ketoacyl-ACP reductase [Marinicella pacifica]
MQLEQQVALVTGASRGIGKSIAETLAQAGAVVIGTATSESGAGAISDYLSAYGGQGRVLDVTDDDSVQQLVTGLKEASGLPQILVNNAGITEDKLLMRMSATDWQRVLDTNLSAIYRMSKAFIRGMMKTRNGRIINIGSVIGSMGNAGQSNYAAAKAGLIGFSKALAQEVGARGITVNVVAPGYIQTDMTADLPEDQKTALLDKIPLQKLGETDDIARAVLFLAAESGRYITGETLHVNGGMYMA